MDESATPHSDHAFRLKLEAIAIALVVGLGILFFAMVSIEFVKLVVKLPERPQMPWIRDAYYDAAYVALGLAVFARLRRRHHADLGLDAPVDEAFAMTALRWGILFGIVTAAVDYFPQLLTFTRPADNPYPLTWFNVGGWILLEGVVGAFVEELLFRGILMTYLSRSMPGRIVVRGVSLSGAGVVAAVFYAVYSAQILSKPMTAPFQLVYAFVFGLAYAHWYERSRSLVAPVIAHAAANVVKYALVFAMVATFR